MTALFDTLVSEFDKLKSNERLNDSLGSTDDFISKLEGLYDDLNEDKDIDIYKEVKKAQSSWQESLKKNLKTSNSNLVKFNRSTLEKIEDFELNDVYIYKIAKTPRNLELIDNAIKLHLIRNGDLSILGKPSDVSEALQDIVDGTRVDISILNKFTEMNNILKHIQLKELTPAVEWCIANEEALKLSKLGTNLEFSLHKLQYLQFYNDGKLLEAYEYASKWLPKFITENESLADVSKLITSILYDANDFSSPYYEQNKLNNALFQELSILFSKEFCSVLGFSFESSIFTIILSGFISFPNFLKFIKIKNLNNKLDWTSHEELPFEINLPTHLKTFHPIFICPVSKEETTDSNPPMALPCHHIISKQSLSKLSRNSSAFKCPYCPFNTLPAQCKQVTFHYI